MQQLVQIVGRDPGNGFLFGNQAFVHHLYRGADRRLTGALGPSGLQHVQPAALNGELEVLYVSEMTLQRPRHPLQVGIALGHSLLQRRDRFRRPDAGHHVLSLSVEEVLPVEFAFAGRRIPGKRHPGARVLAHVSEDHRHDADRGAHRVGDIVVLPVVDGAPRVPALEHRGHRPPELFHGIFGELLPRFLVDQPFVLPDQVPQRLPGKVDVPGSPGGLFALVERFVEYPLGYFVDDSAIHLHESAIGVEREIGVAGADPERLDRRVVQAEIENGLHHAGHGDRGAGAHRHQQRVVRAAELTLGGRFQVAQRRLQLGFQPGREAAGLEIDVAQVRGEGEARRHRDAEVGHFGEPGALAAERVLHRGGAVGAPLPEEVDQWFGRGGPGHGGVVAKGESPTAAALSRGVTGIG